MKPVLIASLIAAAVTASPDTFAFGEEGHQALPSHLTVTRDARGRRPAILLAWRNSNKVFEAEIGIGNTSEMPGKASVELLLVDNDGHVLLRRPDDGSYVEGIIPPAGKNGVDPTIMQMNGTRDGNLLLDQLDRANIGYTMIASVKDETGGGTSIASKTFNVSNRIRAGHDTAFDFSLRNRHATAGVFKVKVDAPASLPGSILLNANQTGTEIALGPDEAVPISAIFRAGKRSETGDNADVVFSLIDTADGRIVDQREWFLVSDDAPPTVSDEAVRVQPESGLVQVEVTAGDAESGIREASGVRVDYSTDNGVTSSSRVLTYLDGDFIRPTRFFATLGPFAKNTRVKLWLTVTDTAGNSVRKSLPEVSIEQPS